MDHQPHPAIVLALLNTGEWSLTRNLPDPDMTDEYSRRTAWAVSRQMAPFADKAGTRTWFGPTAYAAFEAAHAALFDGMRPLPMLPEQGSLIASQLVLHFSVGPAGDENDETAANRQTRSYDALTGLLASRGLAELGTSSDGCTFMPVELCECEWGGQVVDGQAVYTVAFHSDGPIDSALATKLRKMSLEAYTSVCEADARFIRAELSQKWQRWTRSPVQLPE